MWQPVVRGHHSIKKIFASENGVWIAGYRNAFFVPNSGGQSAFAVYEYGEDWEVLGAVGDALFLHDPYSNMVVAHYPDGRRERVAVAAGESVPVAVSCYRYEIFSHLQVGKAYVYSMPRWKRLAVGKNFAVEWERYGKQVGIYRQREDKGLEIVVTSSLAHIEDVIVGETIICLEMLNSIVFSPDRPGEVCKAANITIGENTDLIAVHEKGKVYCWKWGSEKHSIINAPADMHRIFICGDRIFGHSARGIFFTPFPELNVEGPFPFFSRGLWTEAQEEKR